MAQPDGQQFTTPEYGSFTIRGAGFLIDWMLVGGISGVLTAFSGATGSAVGILIGIAYYVGLNANGGTLGKRVVGLRLQSEKFGEDIGYGAALVRYMVAIASGIVLLLGYLWVLWDDKRQTWHDKAAGSVVVRL